MPKDKNCPLCGGRAYFSTIGTIWCLGEKGECKIEGVGFSLEVWSEYDFYDFLKESENEM